MDKPLKFPVLRVYLLFNDIYLVLQLFVGVYLGRDFVYSIDDRGVIFLSKKFCYVHVGDAAYHIIAEIHYNLSWQRKFSVALFGGDIIRIDTEMFGYNVDDS